MRNGFLVSLLSLLLGASLATGQDPPRRDAPGLDAPWQPPRTDLDDRPNVAPKGYAFYGRVDYLAWWTEQDHPVRSLAAGPAFAPGNAILGEGTDFGALFRHGVDGIFGLWLDPQQRFGVEAGGLWLWNRQLDWHGVAGNLGVLTAHVDRLWAGEADLRCELFRGTHTHLDLLGGFRHLNFEEGLSIAERDFASNAIAYDNVGARNRFYGGQLGVEAELHHGSWSVDLYGKVALGANCAEVNVVSAALTAGSSGRRHHDVFAAVPEIGLNAAYQLTNNLRVSAGYTFLYLSDAVRPGDQIDAWQHAPHGVFPISTTEFWGQGLSFGLEFRF